ncbi:hypothetical protein GCM10011534_42650 [Pseudooceanicola nanhaiensis]|uniref:Uncharacterized protein n=1 Tax=Pseudooceanicola nanhaiensis TaxID=375761 RepID=A0A917TAB9_9RHOB|nr:hypothetical protein GCM10011534_42650 [Pseudooceanicola nanhaiensis]
MVAVATPLAEDIAKASGGELTINIVPGGALGSVRVTLKALSNSAIDMGMIADFYTPAELPNSVVLSDFGTLGKDSRVMTAAINENLLLACQNCLAEYTERDIVPLMMYSTTPYALMCKDGDVSSFQAVQGKKVRGTGGMG